MLLSPPTSAILSGPRVRAMSDDSDSRRRFRLIPGLAGVEHRVGRVLVSAERAGAVPVHSWDALVLEEDTWLTMSAPAELSLPTEPLLRVMTELISWKPREPGEVIEKPGQPTCLLAVVYDLGEVPPSRAEWVAAALDRILDPASGRPLRRIAMPLLGTRYGGVEPETSLRLLRGACERAEHTLVSELRLQLDETLSLDLLQVLDDGVAEH